MAVGMTVGGLLSCPISQKLMQNPVTTQCGHTFEEDRIVRWLQEKTTECPLCRAALRIGELRANWVMKEICDVIRVNNIDLQTKVQDLRLTPENQGLLNETAEAVILASVENQVPPLTPEGLLERENRRPFVVREGLSQVTKGLVGKAMVSVATYSGCPTIKS